MGRIKARIDASFGELIIEGEKPQEILETLQNLPENFMDKTTDLISKKLTPTKEIHLKGIVEFTQEGPIVATQEDLTHYEAIGLVLYATEGMKDKSTHIRKLLKSSGIESSVPARLYEMNERGLVFKPDPDKHHYKLTAQGKKWIEELITKIKEDSQ